MPGQPFHVIHRGNNRAVCFYSDEDYQFYLYHLQRLSERYQVKLHAYVLMTNHVHLLMTGQQQDSLSNLMKYLGQRYVQYINKTYKRSGTLWEGRFKSCLIDADQYLLECQRYIELNPVRADMVEHPADYRWSSYRSNGQGDSIHWLGNMRYMKAWQATYKSDSSATGNSFAINWNQGLLMR